MFSRTFVLEKKKHLVPLLTGRLFPFPEMFSLFPASFFFVVYKGERIPLLRKFKRGADFLLTLRPGMKGGEETAIECKRKRERVRQEKIIPF